MKDSQELFQKIFDSSPAAMALSRLSDGRFLEANESFSKLTGYALDEVVGLTATEADILADPKKREERLAALKQGELLPSFEVEVIRKSGEIRNCIATVGIVSIQDMQYALSTLIDVTERKLAEKQVIQMKRLYATLSHVNETIVRSKNRAELYQSICKVAVQFGEFSLAWIGLLDDASKQVKSVAAEGLDATQWPFQVVDIEEGALKDELVATAIRTSKVATSDDIRTDTRMQSLRDQLSIHDYHSSAVIPFRLRGRTIGVVNLISREVGLFKTESEALLLEEMGGDISFALDTIENETEHKLAEEALHESQKLLEDIIDHSPSLIYALDTEGHFILANQKVESLFGVADGQLIGKTRSIALPPEIAEQHRNNDLQVIHSRQAQIFEEENLEANGKHFYLTHKFPLMNPDNQVYAVCGTSTDITERKRAEEIIHQNERQMKALVTSLDDIVFEVDEHETYLNIWTSDERLLAQPKSQMLGRRIVEVLGEEKSRPFIEAVKRVLASGKPENVEYPLEVVGRQRWFLARVSPILAHDDSPRTASMLVRDITERKQAEKQIQLQLRRISALNDIDRAIGSSLDMRLSLDILLNEVLAQLGVDAASILLLNTFNQTLEYIAGKGFRTLNIRRSTLKIGEGLAGRVGLERKVLLIPNLDEIGDQFQRRELLKDEKFVEYFGIPLIAKGTLKGVLEVFHRARLFPDPDWLNYLETLGGQAAIAIDNVQMFEGVQQSNLELVTAYDATIIGWSRAMDMRDKETEGHTQRVTELTVQLAKKMGIHQQEIVQMRRGALLHDIGKLGVPDNILLKPDALTKIEWAVMRQHPTYAFNMLMSINYLRAALDIPYCHHKKWDGSGYPRALSGEQIPLAARIFAIVDVWDALRSDRPYRAAWTIEKTREHIIEGSGTHFDPRVVEAFISLLDELPDLR